MAAADI